MGGSLSAGTVSLAVKADTSGFGSRLGSQIRGESSHFSTAGKVMGGAILSGIGAAMAGVGLVLKTGFDEAKDASAGIAQLTAGIKSTGNQAHVSVQGMTDLAGSIQALSGQTDDSIVKSEQLLLTFTNIKNSGPNKIFDQATLASANMAAKMGGDASSSAILLGKALNDPAKGITALTRVGVSFTEGQKKTIKAMVASGDTMGAQKLILKELNTEFGGAAKAAGESLPGQLARGKRAFEDMSQSIVETIIPIVVPAITAIGSVITKTVMPAIAGFVKGFAEGSGAAGVFKEILGTVWDVIKVGAGFIMNTVVPGIRALVAAFQAGGNDVTSSGFAGGMERIGLAARVVIDYIRATVIPGIQRLAGVFMTQVLPAIQRIVASFITNLLPVLQNLGTIFVTKVIPAVQAAVAYFIANLLPIILKVYDIIATKVIPIIGSLAQWFTGTLLPAVVAIYQKIATNLKPVLDAIFQVIQEKVIPAVTQIIAKFQEWRPTIQKVIEVVVAVIGKVLEFASAILGKVMPPLLSFAGFLIGTIVSAVVKVIDIVVKVIAKVIEFGQAGIKAKDWIVDAFGKVVSFVTGMPGKIASAASGMWDGLKNSFKSAINWIISAWNNFSFTIGGGNIMGIDIPKVTLDTPNIPLLAQGATVMPTPGGTLVRVAEAGKAESVVDTGKLNRLIENVAGANGGRSGPVFSGDIYLSDPVDVDLLMSRAGFAMSTGALGG